MDDLKRYEGEIGGCGDPACCGDYVEMNEAADGGWVRWEDAEALEADLQWLIDRDHEFGPGEVRECRKRLEAEAAARVARNS